MLCYTLGMKLSAYAKQQGVSYQTTWRMWQRGELPTHQLPSGTVIVDVPPMLQAVRPQKVAIITSFCARLYGRRRASRTKPALLSVLEEDVP
jgi:predicted site-specific integrase-resolvase